jgi:TP901 family phage tail tape measure protein
MAIDLDVHGNTKPLEAAVQAAVNRIRRQPIKITVDDKGATQPLGNMKRGADEFTKSMEAANARILAFGASMAIINGVANAFKGMVKNLVEVEKAMADVNVVMGLSAQNLEKFSDGLFKVAKETGAAFRVAADAATEYARQGLGVEESLKRTRDALVLTRLTGMDSAEAVKSLTAAMNTYGTQIKDTTQLVSKFAAVDVKFAVSAQDFADAISRTGQSAQSAGVSIDELVGIVTAAQQKTARGGAVIGNALKTIFTKTGKTDTLNQLENLGIAVRDLEGNTIGAQRILNDLANTFDTLSAAQKAQITQTMGGLFHINILKAVLSDAAKQNGIMAEATRISAGATDEAIQKNEELRKTMSAVATETGLAIKQVSTQIGEIALAPGMEKILNSVKSLAEGLSGVLGDGESTGSSFATGLLKGIGNVITGPGLVVLAGVFFKLFGQALKFTKESLTSLVGVTTEKQKQKAIQTSLVALFGQNAALNKEMLRTDIGRTEKEKIILGLLKAQVVEAKALNTLTAGMAGTLYRKGYGANLTPVGKKASGHIPNYANPERAQAAQGGYAAGSIRSMNMPGEGPVIYNSAETVKNFAGFKQPAIMPPQSSKAGKNYQQAFGNIHGFDPYAAGGYIPNFKKSKAKTKEKAGPPINLNSLFGSQIKSMGVLLGFGSEGPAKGQKYSQTYNSLPPNAKAVLKKKNIVDRGTSQVVAKLPTKAVYEVTEADVGKIGGVLGKSELEKKLYHYVGRPFDKFSQAIGMDMFGGKVGKAGINVLKTHMEGSVLGGLFESAVRGSLDNKKVKDSQAPFDFTGSNAENIAGFMGNKNLSLIEAKYNLSAAKGGGIPKKVLNYIYKNSKGSTEVSHTSDLITKKGEDIYVGAEKFDNTNKDQINRLEEAELPTTWQKLNKLFNASGFIPNFADPLSDAIGREKAAGVPVSQIRVGSHGALMSKGNPLGLGVTNTHDEPNGLRDVFGANGFVPNYFNPLDGIKSSIANTKFGQNWEKATTEHAKKIEKLNRRIEQRVQAIQKHNQELSTLTKGTSEYRAAQSKLKSTTSNLDKTRAKLSVLEKSSATGIGGRMGRLSSGLGRAFSGNTGMAMMMGAPMAAGFLQQGGMGAQGGNQSMYAAGGALTGAASGAMMASVIAPMFGPGAPLVIALGGAVGAYQGWASATEENTKALKNAELKRQQGVVSSFVTTSPKFMQKFSKNIFDDMSQEGKQVMKMAAPKYTATTPPDISEKDFLTRGPNNPIFKMKIPFISDLFGPSAGEIDQITKYREQGDQQNEFQKIQKYQVGTMKKAIGSMGDEEFLLPSYIKDKEGKIQKQDQPERQKASDYLKKLEKIDFFKVEDTGDVKRIEALRSALYKIYQEQITAEHDQSEAIILQLNIQKVMLESQKRAKQAQFNISSSMQAQASNLSLMEKTMGGFATEQQKAQFKYIGSINKAAETYASSAQQAENAFESNMLGVLKDDDVKSKVKTALAKRIKERGGGKVDANKLDVSDELINLSQEERQEMYKELKLGDDITKNIENQVTARENALSLAAQQVNQSNSIAQSEFRVNDAIARRKDLISNLKSGGALMSQALGHAQAMRGMDAQVGAAQRLTNVGPGYQTRAEQEAFQMREKQIALEDQIKTIRENATIELQKEQTNLEEIKMEEQQLLDLKAKRDSFVGAGAELDEDDLATLNGLIQTEDKRNQAKEKTQNAIDNILKKSEKEVSTAEKLLALEEKRLAAKRAHETGPGAFGRGMSDTTKSMREQVKMMDYELGKRIPSAFADGLAGAMTEAINGTKSLKDALTDAAVGFLGMIQQAMMQKMAYQMVGATGLFSRGGNVRKYSKGGGVPAMVSNGEYVMGRDAVNKYGGSFMHGMNAGGRIPGFASGGSVENDLLSKGKIRREGAPGGPAAQGSALASNFGGGRGFDSGRLYQRKAMSGSFYAQSGNVGLGEDTSAIQAILSEEERLRQEAEAKRQAKKAKRRQLLGMVASIGLMYGLGKMNLFGSKTPQGSMSAPTRPGSVGAWFLNPTNRYMGGPIRKYASGGHIAGKSGIDQIPAMLSEGEYVIRASSARQIGKPMLDQINAGKFNEGGPVSEIGGSSETGSTGGNTNNISISVNMERGSSNKQQQQDDSSGQNPADKSNEEQSNAKLAERIKQQVVSVIVEEQRPGGLLSD